MHSAAPPWSGRPDPAYSRCAILVAPGLPRRIAAGWAPRGPAFVEVGQGDWQRPDLDAWAGAIAAAAAQASRPAVVVAEGFGCLATVQAAALRPGVIAGALLLAPADPAALGLDERLWDLAPDFPSVLVAGEDEAGLSPAGAWQWALRWNSQFASLGRERRRLGRPDQAQGDNGLDLLEQLCRRVLSPG